MHVYVYMYIYMYMYTISYIGPRSNLGKFCGSYYGNYKDPVIFY